MKKVLFITTSHSQLGDTGRPTGLWLEELAVPYYILLNSGYEVEIASIKGGKVPIDPASYKEECKNPKTCRKFVNDFYASNRLNKSFTVKEVKPEIYLGVFFPGGHGTMWDFPDNKHIARIVNEIYSNEGVVAAICHGAAGLLNATNEYGDPIIENRQISCFTNEEEKSIGLDEVVPFLLETKIRELGADFKKAKNFTEFTVVDNNLITGQNPASSAKVARLMLDYLDENF